MLAGSLVSGSRVVDLDDASVCRSWGVVAEGFDVAIIDPRADQG